MAGKRGRGRGRRGRRGGRRLVDPGVDIEMQVLITLLRKTHRVHRDELLTYDEVPAEYGNESPEVQAKNRGVNTIYRQIAHLRRRFLNLMRLGAEHSAEGVFVQARLDMFEKEVIILHKQIEAMNGIYYAIPDAFYRPLALLN